MWQDVAISVGTVILTFALIPIIKDVWGGKALVPLFTSFTTCVVLFAIAACYASLGLFMGMMTSIMTAFMWGAIHLVAILKRDEK